MADLNRNWLGAVVRLPAGADADGLRRQFVTALRTVEARAGASAEAVAGTTVTFSPANRGVDSVRRNAEQPLQVLAVVSWLVLLIACTNLAGIMLARGVTRQRDIAVRRALGASRAGLIRQWALESIMLASAGGVAGVLAAVWGGPVIMRLLTTTWGPVSVDLGVDGRLLTIALATTLVTALCCGVVPALRLTSGDAVEDLRTRVVGASSPKLVIGRLLIAVQIAISVPLLIGALLFLRTLHNLAAVDLGFDPRGLVTFQLSTLRTGASFPFSETMASPDEVNRVRGLLERLEGVPGVVAATVYENPLVGGFVSNTKVTIGGAQTSMLMNAVGPRFFETLRIPLLAGRELTLRDDAHAPLVVVINRAAADRYFSGGSPIGRTFLVGARTVEIVGLVGDAVYDSLRRQPRPIFYDSYLQRAGGTYFTSVAVRTAVGPASLVESLRGAVASVDRDLPITHVVTELEQIDQTNGKARVFTRLLTAFGVFALLLASIGLHGLTSYAVARRTNEIGIRLALGATRGHVLWLMLRQVVVLAFVGLFIGVPAALAAGRFVDALLFGVAPRDPWTVGGASILLLLVATAAGWLPARRAARMEALTALRHE